MLFHVYETHRNGVKLSRAEILAADPVPGQLLISDWPVGNAEARALRVAYLKHPTSEYHPNQLTPLFDPVIVRMTKEGFLLVGWQVRMIADGETLEFKQGWWIVKAVSKNETPKN